MRAPKNTSTVVVALPAEGHAIHSFGPEQKHATLLFLGEIDDPTAVHAITREMASSIRSVTIPTKSVEGLGEDEPQAIVMKLADDQLMMNENLAGIRHDLLTDPNVRRMYEAIKQYPRFTAHVTLGYGDEVPPRLRAEAIAQVSSITFDRLAVWHRDDQTEYPLQPMYVENTMVAAARFVRSREGSERYGVPIGSKIEVDKQGNVISVHKPGGRKDRKPNRDSQKEAPNKFVPTVPGQAAKLPSTEALKAYAQRVQQKAKEPEGGGRSAPVSAPKAKPGGIDKPYRGALKRIGHFEDALGGKLSNHQTRLLQSAANGKPLSKHDTQALREMLRKTLRKLTKPEDSGGGGKDKGGKQPKKDDKKPKKDDKKPKKGENEKPGKQKTEKDSFSTEEWISNLRTALKALGGTVPKSARPKAMERSADDGGKKHEKKDRPKVRQSFTSLSDKELGEESRKLVAQKRGQKGSTLQIDTALKKIRLEHQRRDKIKQESVRRRRQLERRSK
jgi:2'-5' RNA ligase